MRDVYDNIEYLKQELDAKSFLHLAIFSENEKENILKQRTTSRSGATQLMFDIVVMKSEDEVRTLIEEIKQKKEYVWENIFKAGKESYLLRGVMTTYIVYTRYKLKFK